MQYNTSLNKAIIEQRFSKAAKTYDSQAKAQKIICRKMLQLIKLYADGHEKKILEFGAGTGFMTNLLIGGLTPESMIVNDLCREMESHFIGMEERCKMSYIWGDAENIDFPYKNDIVVGCSCIQWFGNIPGFINKCHDILSDDGMLAISTFSKENLREFRQVTGYGLDYLSVAELRDIIEKRFDIVHFSMGNIEIVFDTPYNILRHLKQTGVTGTCSQPWTKGKVTDFCYEYQRRFSRANGVRLSYAPVYIIAKKKNK